MKKNYIQPAIEVLKMSATTILAGSFAVDADDVTEEGLARELGF